MKFLDRFEVHIFYVLLIHHLVIIVTIFSISFFCHHKTNFVFGKPSEMLSGFLFDYMFAFFSNICEMIVLAKVIVKRFGDVKKICASLAMSVL